MLRTLIIASVAGIAAVAGRQLYRNGALQRMGEELKNRAEGLRRTVDERRGGHAASHEAAGGPGGGAVRPVAVHNHRATPAT